MVINRDNNILLSLLAQTEIYDFSLVRANTKWATFFKGEGVVHGYLTLDKYSDISTLLFPNSCTSFSDLSDMAFYNEKDVREEELWIKTL